MNGKLNKFLISLSGFLALILGLVGFRFQKEMAEAKALKENLQKSLKSVEKVESMIELQTKLEAARLENLQKVDSSKIGTKTETTTQTVVIPGKTVQQTTTQTATKSTKTTKSS